MLLSVAQVAERLGVGETTVYRLLREGRLRRLKIGTLTRVDARDVEAFVDGLHGVPERPAPERISAGQLRALHAMADELDRREGVERGASKVGALREASTRFGRTIDSAAKLSSLEASEILDWFETRLVELRRADARERERKAASRTGSGRRSRAGNPRP
jgi:excisionase family DNA binding protein